MDKNIQAMHDEMKRTKQYFPFRKVCGVMLQDGTFQVFAHATIRSAKCYARKNNGALYEFHFN